MMMNGIDFLTQRANGGDVGVSSFAVCEHGDWDLWGLTFELTGRQRQDAKPGPVRMYRVPPARAWWPAVGAPVERGVRPQRQAGQQSPTRSEMLEPRFRRVRSIRSLRRCERPAEGRNLGRGDLLGSL